MFSFKGMRFPIDVILVCIRWYAAYPLSYRHIEEMMGERGVSVERSTINRWAIRFLPVIEKLSRKHKRQVGTSWRMDETYIKVKGTWKYLYRAVDKGGRTVDFLLMAHRDMGPPSDSLKKPCVRTARLKGSRWIKAAPTRQPSTQSTAARRPRSRFIRSSTSTTSSNKTIARSNA
jgi:hypothetical protein